MTLGALLRKVARLLEDNGVENAGFEAKQLLYFILQTDVGGFLLRQSDAADEQVIQTALRLTEERCKGEPLQYIIGSWDFLEDAFDVGPGVLIPRPETEDLVLHCERFLWHKPRPVILDLCAGSGCIGLSLQKRCSQARVFLVEQSDDALYYLRRNAEKIGVADQAIIVRGDVLQGAAAFPELPKADLIVSNPPYICSDELALLQSEVLAEPRMALDGGADGLKFYRCFAASWRSALKDDGVFAFECSEGQSNSIAALFSAFHWQTKAACDFNHFDRYVFAAHSRKDLL